MAKKKMPDIQPWSKKDQDAPKKHRPYKGSADQKKREKELEEEPFLDKLVRVFASGDKPLPKKKK